MKVFFKTAAMIGKNNFLNKLALIVTAYTNFYKLNSFHEFYL